MGDWRDIQIEGVASLAKIVAVFHIWSTTMVPYAKCKIKIVEDAAGHYTGHPNIAAKNKQTGTGDWVYGSGKTISEALEDTIRKYFQTVVTHQAVSEEDFEFADPQIF